MRGVDVAEVHIVLTTYNGEKYIREQLDSILANTFQDVMVEICDDGSTDSTLDIAREYVEQYDQISLYQNEKNLGYTKNFLEGIRRSRSPYVMLCDQDDIWHRDKIEKTLRRMKEMESQNGNDIPLMVFTDAMNFDSDSGEELGSFHKSSHLDVKRLDSAHLFMENKCIGCTVMMNGAIRQYLQEFPDEIRVHDWWLALICSHFGKISYIKETTLHYRQHGGNMIGGSSFSDYVRARVSDLRSQRQVIRQTFLQGRAFYKVFGERLSGEKGQIAKHFAGMAEAGAVRRRVDMIRFGFCKSGFVRNAALFLLI